VQHVQDPVEHQTIGDRLAPGVAAAARAGWEQRLDLGPQLVIDLEPGRHCMTSDHWLGDTADIGDGFKTKAAQARL
jgi:hypothetical protein